MKFKALPVTSLEDATIDFEQLSSRTILDSSATNFLQLLAAGTSRFTSGTGSVVFTAASNTPSVAVAHGLGVKPQRFWAITTNGFAAAAWMQVDVIANWSTTTVAVAGFCYTSITATVAFQWFAVG